MSRNVSIILGVCGISSGLGLVYIAAQGHGEEGITSARPMIWGAILVVIGLVRLMSAQSFAQQRGRHEPPPDDPRWRADDRGPQLAGRPCTECGKKITVAFEAVLCDVCGDAAHEDCVADHRAHAHAPPAAGPFR